MTIVVKNVNLVITISLTALKLAGFWAPGGLSYIGKLLYKVYGCFSFMFLLGTYLVMQVGDLYVVWGDIPLMTGTAFLLFTNMAHTLKIVNLVFKKRRIQAIVDDSDEMLRSVKNEEERAIVRSCNRETSLHLLLYCSLTLVTGLGWASSAEKNQLPLRAWYPYDTTKSPAYELTYAHQIGAIFMAGYLNVGKDSLVASLIAQCRCRLQLLGHSLRTFCQDMQLSDKLTRDQEAVVCSRLRACILQHEATLAATRQLQDCFSVPTFAQFTVSLIIICVTAFQMVSQTGNFVRLFAMATFLMNMMFQVFIYCYQGHHLAEESADVAGAAYECPWYTFPVRLRKVLLIVMTRTRRVARLTAGGFTTLSLDTFMAIIKASYSLFTLLQQVEEKK